MPSAWRVLTVVCWSEERRNISELRGRRRLIAREADRGRISRTADPALRVLNRHDSGATRRANGAASIGPRPCGGCYGRPAEQGGFHTRSEDGAHRRARRGSRDGVSTGFCAPKIVTLIFIATPGRHSMLHCAFTCRMASPQQPCCTECRS